MGDIALTNRINRQTNWFHYFVQYPKYKFFVLPQPRARMFSISASRFYEKMVNIAKEIVLGASVACACS